MKKIINLIFNIDPFIFVYPQKKLGILNKKNVIKNIFFYSKNFNLKQNIKYVFYLIRLIFLDISKLIYSPLILLIYLTEYRFLKLSPNQIGVLAHHLDAMIKSLLLNNKKPIIIIPSYSKYKDVFTNLLNDKFIYFNNSLISILCLPLIHSNKISISPEFVETFFNENKIKNKNFYNKILTDYEDKFKNSYELFCFNKNRREFLQKLTKLKFNNIDLKKTYILHTRDKEFYKTSNLRTSDFENYLDSIEFLLNQNYSIIRIVHTNQKSNFERKNYYEFDFETCEDKDLQIYLIKESKGIICNHGGLSSVAALLGVPICQTNVIPFDHSHGHKETDLILHKKLKKNNITLNFNEIFNSNLKYCIPSEIQKYSVKVIDNSKFEILDVVKIFNSGMRNQENKIVQANEIFKNIGKGTSIRYSKSYIYKS